MTAALTLDRISKRYGSFEAVRDLSFAVEQGTICGFLGPNGAGKTTTIRMILGLQPATSGAIRILDAGDGPKGADRTGSLQEELAALQAEENRLGDVLVRDLDKRGADRLVGLGRGSTRCWIAMSATSCWAHPTIVWARRSPAHPEPPGVE